MVNNESKQFCIYVLSEVLPNIVGLTADYYTLLSRLAGAGVLPGFDISVFKNRQVTREEWVNQITPKIADHFAQSWNPARTKASA